MNSFILRTDDGDIVASPTPLPVIRLHNCDIDDLRALMADLPPDNSDAEILILSQIARLELHDRIGSDAYDQQIQTTGTLAHALSQAYWWATNSTRMQDSDITLIEQAYPRLATILWHSRAGGV